jgi:crossover junction endodeoxyribonuclease RusA
MVKCFKLKYPISANRYWRIQGKIIVLSDEAKEYKSYVKFKYFYESKTMFEGDVSVKLELLPKLTKKGKASKVVLDLDNSLKVSLDALNEVAFMDDKQVKEIHAFYGKPVEDGGLIITVEEWNEPT